MSKKKNSKLASILIGPVLIIGGILALWENEGRFNYFEAAKDAVVISSPLQYAGEAVSYTSDLDMTIPIEGEYVVRFESYHVINRRAQIYSWDEDTDSDGHTTWRKRWSSSLESNSRNSGLQQRLSSTHLYPEKYSLGELVISPTDIHFVDEYSPGRHYTLERSQKARSLGLDWRSGYLYLDKGRSDKLGDERISYRGIPNAEVASYFGVVEGEKGVGRQFEENNGIISGIIANDGILHHLVNGERDESLIKIEADFTRTVWYTRLGGTAAIIFGINTFLSAFMSLLYRIPLFGNLVEYSVFVISLLLGLPIALIVIFSSLVVHNLVSIALPVFIIVGGAVYFVRRSRATGRNARRVLSSRLSERESEASPRQHQPYAATSDLEKTSGLASRRQGGTADEEGDFVFEIGHESLPKIERIFLHLATMALADGGLKKRENKMLVNWGVDNGVEKERIKELFIQAKSAEVDMGETSRTDLELLACMALVDGELSRSEWKLLTKIAEKMGVPGLELRNIINDIETSRLLPA